MEKHVTDCCNHKLLVEVLVLLEEVQINGRHLVRLFVRNAEL